MRTSIAVASLLFTSATFSATPPKEWVRFYSGSAGFYNVPKAVTVDTEGNVYVTGESATGLGGAIATVSYTSDGTLRWVQRLADADTDGNRPAAIALTNDGAVIVGGFRSGAGNFGDYVVVKYDAATGAEQWQTRINGAGNNLDGLSAFALDSTGSIYATGQSWSGVDYDYLTVKLNAAGEVQWTRSRDGVKGGPDGINDAGTGIAVDDAGNAYVTGWVQVGYDSSEEINQYAYGTVKYDTTGNEQWFTVTGDTKAQGQAIGIIIGAGGDPIVTGSIFGRAVTARYDAATGNEIWLSLYGGPVDSGASPYVISRTPTGDAIIGGGVCTSTPSCLEAAGIWKVSAFTGDVEWINLYRDTNPLAAGTSLRSVFVDANSNVYGAGFTLYFSGNSNVSESLAITLDPNGNRLWLDSFNTDAAIGSVGFAITADNGGHAFLAAQRRTTTSQSQYMTIKYGAFCPPDFDGDGFITGIDFDLYVAAFENGDSAADFDRDGFITGIDYDLFVLAFEAGC